MLEEARRLLEELGTPEDGGTPEDDGTPEDGTPEEQARALRERIRAKYRLEPEGGAE